MAEQRNNRCDKVYWTLNERYTIIHSMLVGHTSIMPFLTGPELPTLQPLNPHFDRQLPLDVVAVYPMTRAQEGLWLAYSLAPHHTLYNLTMKFAFTKESKAEFDYSLDALHGGEYWGYVDHATAKSGRSHKHPHLPSLHLALNLPQRKQVSVQTVHRRVGCQRLADSSNYHEIQ